MIRTVVGIGAALALAACASDPNGEMDGEPIDTASLPLTALCDVTVAGVGARDVELNYLPHVVMCENGAASFEALKAQAVAARTYLYYSLKGVSGTIADGANAQVYSCGKEPSSDVVRAVSETAGEVLQYEGATICSFFVAGGKGDGPSCVGASSASTEKYVTYNEGRSGDSIHQSTLGSTNPKNKANRGCMSQNGADCLAENGKEYQEILRFYYGADISIVRAAGACIATTGDDEHDPTTGGDGGDVANAADATGDGGGAGIAPVTSLPDVEGGCAMARSLGNQSEFSIKALVVAIGMVAIRKGRRSSHSRV